ncbi:hypothetical protein BAE44_0005078 [Dichanthelium oligosanthes]|uniref:Uncharacterized protein n=1 Tax=Dichanthelium oligosanthes TaxID=888268 RepID=A0A1E5W907_9POAL|nr:hypothetical protein BAE44_0005078 [Dichanthelium oligosanthes]
MGGGERAERQRWDGMCEWGDDRWGPVAEWPSRNRATTNCTPHPSGYTTIGTEQRKISVDSFSKALCNDQMVQYVNIVLDRILEAWPSSSSNELTEKCLVFDGVIHTTFMEGHWKLGKGKEAIDNYQSLLQRGFKMTSATCNVLLETLFKHDKHKEAPPSFIGINAESYNVMVNQCFKEGKFQ